MTHRKFIRQQRAFSILEVMIAIAILSVALTAIFSSQVGAVNTAKRAEYINNATLLARCKMGELEEKIAKEGMPAVVAEGHDSCCVQNTDRNYRCDWKIERIVLPDDSQNQGGAGDGGMDDLKKNGLPGSAKDLAANPAAAAGSMFGTSGMMGDPTTGLSAGSSGGVMSMMGSMMGGGGIGQLAMQFALPALKPLFEEQVRRLKVHVKWKEGSKEYGFKLSQFFVQQTGAGMMDPTLLNNMGAAGMQNPAQPGSTSSSSPTTSAVQSQIPRLF